MLVATRQPTADGVFRVSVLEVPEAALEVDEAGDFTVNEEKATNTVASLSVRGDKNSLMRLKKLCADHAALDLTDKEEVMKALKASPPAAPPPAKKAKKDKVVTTADVEESHVKATKADKVLSVKPAEPDPEPEGAEPPVKKTKKVKLPEPEPEVAPAEEAVEALVSEALADSTNGVEDPDESPADLPEEPVIGKGKKHPKRDIRAKKTTPPPDTLIEATKNRAPVDKGDLRLIDELRYTPKQITRMSDEARASILEHGIPADAASIRKDGSLKVLKSELPEDHPYLGVLGEGAAELVESTKAAIDRKEEKRAKEHKPRKISDKPKLDKKRPINGYSVIVRNPAWGKDQFYKAGSTPSEEEANAAVKMWMEVGYQAEAQPRRSFTPPKHTLLTSPHDPIKCIHEGCGWVGDHLAPHIRSRHQLDIAGYRAATSYSGPILTGRAEASLNRAHDVVRRSTRPRVAGMVVEIKGDSDVAIYRIDKYQGEGDDAKFTLSVLASTWTQDFEIEMTLIELIEKTKPVQRWNSSMKNIVERFHVKEVVAVATEERKEEIKEERKARREKGEAEHKPKFKDVV